MNHEQKMINRIKTLKGIKPDTNWVVLAKARIIGVEVGQRRSILALLGDFTYKYRAAFAGLLVAVFTGGTLAIAQSALPGEPLYSVKKATEKGIAIINGQDKTPAANLQLAAKRLEEINLVSQKNLVKNLPAAFKEYKDAKAAAKKEVAALIAQNPDQAGAIVKNVGTAMKDIGEREKQVYAVLGLEDSASSTDNGSEIASDKTIVGSLIDYFKKDAVLAEEQGRDLARVKELYDAGNYGEAINYYLNSSLNK